MAMASTCVPRGSGEAIVTAGGGYDTAELYMIPRATTRSGGGQLVGHGEDGQHVPAGRRFRSGPAFAPFGGLTSPGSTLRRGDTFKGEPKLSTLTGTGFHLEAHTFEEVHAIAAKGHGQGHDRRLDGQRSTWSAGRKRGFMAMKLPAFPGLREAIVTAGGGFDTAELYDSKGDDTFQAAANWWATVKTGTTFLRADGFDQVKRLPGFGRRRRLAQRLRRRRHLRGGPKLSTLTGPGFHLEAHTFEEVHAVATKGGDDSATFVDTDGDERLVTWTTESRLYGAAYYLRAQGFDRVYATSSGGKDTGELHGSGGNDRFVSNGSTASFSGSGYYLETTGFAELEILAGSGDDQAELTDANFALDELPAGVTPNYLAWLRDFEELKVKRTPPQEDETIDAKDKLFATWWE